MPPRRSASPAAPCAASADFLAALAAERGASAHTLAAYRRDLAAASEGLAADGTCLAEAPRAALERLAAQWRSAGLAPATLRRRLSALRGFYAHRLVDGARADNPAEGLMGPGAPRPLPKPLASAHIEKLYAAAAATPGPEGASTMLLLALLYGSGLRVSEACGAPAAPFRAPGDMVVIRGKGGKDRLAPLSAQARNAAEAWLAHRDAAARWRGNPFLFPSRSGAGALTREAVHARLKRLAAVAGVPMAAVSAHRFRHAFATDLLEGGADLRVIQTLLGHADIATTETYTAVARSRKMALVLERHPLAAEPPRGRTEAHRP